MFRKISFLIIVFSSCLTRCIVCARLEEELIVAGKRVGAEVSSAEKDLPPAIQNAMREETADKAAKRMSDLKDYDPSSYRTFLDSNANRMTIARAMARRYGISIYQASDLLRQRLDFEKIGKNMWVPKGEMPAIFEKTTRQAPSVWERMFGQ